MLGLCSFYIFHAPFLHPLYVPKCKFLITCLREQPNELFSIEVPSKFNGNNVLIIEFNNKYFGAREPYRFLVFFIFINYLFRRNFLH